MITIRPLRVSERRAVVALGVEAFSGFGDYRPSLRAWTENPAMQTLVAVTADGRCLGFAVVALVGSVGSARAHLLAIGVDAGVREQGLGGRLLDAALALARREATPWGAGRLHLEVAADNHAARRLFASRGFLPSTPLRPAPALAYDDGRRALSLSAPLDP